MGILQSRRVVLCWPCLGVALGVLADGPENTNSVGWLQARELLVHEPFAVNEFRAVSLEVSAVLSGRLGHSGQVCR